mmetsp:Transcript_9653/g.20847  ORF Transcript_9653/g.20847 Transcript_9653/m.20847 type:complete len:409 (+) Transcript_9653:238-1464(+)
MRHGDLLAVGGGISDLLLHVGILSPITRNEISVKASDPLPVRSVGSVLRPDGSALRPREEDVRQFLVAVNVQEEIDSGSIHGREDGEDFGRTGRGGGDVIGSDGGPFAVEVGADGVGAEVSQDGAVGTHVGDDVEAVGLEDAAGGFVEFGGRRNAQEAVQQPLGEEFGHGLSGVLSVDDPRDGGAFPDGNTFQFPPLDRLPQRRDSGTIFRQGRSRGNGGGGAVGHQFQMPLVAVHGKIGKEDGSVDGVDVRPGQFPVDVARGEVASPGVVVGRGGGRGSRGVEDGGAGPGFWVGDRVGVGDFVGHREEFYGFFVGGAGVVAAVETADEDAEREVLHVRDVLKGGEDVGPDVEGDGAFGGAARRYGGVDHHAVGVAGRGVGELDVAPVVGGGDAYFHGHGRRAILVVL